MMFEEPQKEEFFILERRCRRHSNGEGETSNEELSSFHENGISFLCKSKSVAEKDAPLRQILTETQFGIVESQTEEFAFLSHFEFVCHKTNLLQQSIPSDFSYK
jgi:hypothetical protein